MPTRLRYALAVLALAATAVGAPAATAKAKPEAKPKTPPKPSVYTGVVDVSTVLGLQNESAAGTGMVLTPTGEILTNNHVIRGATSVRVTVTSTGRSYTATVVGYSVANDVAVLQVQGATNLKTVTVGNSSTVKAGQKVLAVGNAGGVGGKPSSAAGTVTATGQTITASDEDGISEQLTSLIQTNARLQPGDSGGPLFNALNRVVGMDTAGSVGFQLSSSQGYSIPINRALAIARQIVAGQASATVHIGSTPYLGVSIDPSADTPGGVTVAGTQPGGPVDQAGIVEGDVITSINGQPVDSFNSLSSALLLVNAGATVTVDYIDRNGVAQTASVVTASGPPQ